MDQKIIELCDEYVKGSLERRSFLQKLAMVTGSTAAAIAMLPLIENNHVGAEVVPKEDLRLDTGYIKYPAETGDMRAYFARPKGQEKLPGVIVIHENKGLQPGTEDVARRVALEGYIAIAPDALSPLGGTPNSVDEARSRMGDLDGAKTVKNYVAAVQYLKTHPQATGKVGCMGFSWGGGMTNQVAVNSPDLTAAVPFYGRQPDAEDVPKIKASVFCQYAGEDRRINEGIEEYAAALKAASADYGMYVHEGAGHGFFNDSRPERHHKEASDLAWKLTIGFFNNKLKL